MMPPRELSVLTCQSQLCPSQFPAESTGKANHKRTPEGIPNVPQPIFVKSGYFEIVHLEHFHMAIAVQADGGEIEMGVLDARLGQEIRSAIIIGGVIRGLACRDDDRDAVQTGELMDRLGRILRPAADEIGVRRRHEHQMQIRRTVYQRVEVQTLAASVCR